jgi:hypothetical protein
MNLIEGHEGPGSAGGVLGLELADEAGAVERHTFGRVLGGGGEIELLAAVFAGDSALAGAEAVQEPGNFRQFGGGEDLDRGVFERARAGLVAVSLGTLGFEG